MLQSKLRGLASWNDLPCHLFELFDTQYKTNESWRRTGHHSITRKEVRDYATNSHHAQEVSLFGQVVETFPCCPSGSNIEWSYYFFFFSRAGITLTWHPLSLYPVHVHAFDKYIAWGRMCCHLFGELFALRWATQSTFIECGVMLVYVYYYKICLYFFLCTPH